MLTEREHNLLVAARRFHRRRVYGKEDDGDPEDIQQYLLDRIKYLIENGKSKTQQGCNCEARGHGINQIQTTQNEAKTVSLADRGIA